MWHSISLLYRMAEAILKFTGFGLNPLACLEAAKLGVVVTQQLLRKFGISAAASDVVLDSVSLISGVRKGINHGVQAYKNFSSYFNADPRQFVTSLW